MDIYEIIAPQLHYCFVTILLFYSMLYFIQQSNKAYFQIEFVLKTALLIQIYIVLPEALNNARRQVPHLLICALPILIQDL